MRVRCPRPGTILHEADGPLQARNCPCKRPLATYNPECRTRPPAAVGGSGGGLWSGDVFAGVAQLVEHNVANVVVVGSNPITRSCEDQAFSREPAVETSRLESLTLRDSYRGPALAADQRARAVLLLGVQACPQNGRRTKTSDEIERRRERPAWPSSADAAEEAATTKPRRSISTVDSHEPQRVRAARDGDDPARRHRSLFRRRLRRADADGGGARLPHRPRAAEGRRASLPRRGHRPGQELAAAGQPGADQRGASGSRRSASRTSIWKRSRCPTTGR